MFLLGFRCFVATAIMAAIVAEGARSRFVSFYGDMSAYEFKFPPLLALMESSGLIRPQSGPLVDGADHQVESCFSQSGNGRRGAMEVCGGVGQSYGWPDVGYLYWWWRSAGERSRHSRLLSSSNWCATGMSRSSLIRLRTTSAYCWSTSTSRRRDSLALLQAQAELLFGFRENLRRLHSEHLMRAAVHWLHFLDETYVDCNSGREMTDLLAGNCARWASKIKPDEAGRYAMVTLQLLYYVNQWNYIMCQFTRKQSMHPKQNYHSPCCSMTGRWFEDASMEDVGASLFGCFLP